MNIQLKEISHNKVAGARTVASRTGMPDAEAMPPPPRPSRTVSIRKAARTISEEAAKAVNLVKVAPDEVAFLSRSTKLRQPAPAPFVSSSANRAVEKRQVDDQTASEKAARSTTIKRSADASLARRPTQSRPKERPRSPEVLGPLATLDELQQVPPFRRPRRKAAQADVIEILSDPEREEEPQAVPAIDAKPADPILSLPPPPRMTTHKLPAPRKASSVHPVADPNTVTGTSPDIVLERLLTFRANLAAALSNTAQTRVSSAEANSLPFVTRWVDYSRKHGVGYVLSDGTVGCIINASLKNGGTPVTHVLVRNGQKWLKKVGMNFERIESVPLEILEDGGIRGVQRKVYKGLGSVKEGPLKDEAERRRTLRVLWVKFGRYMCQSLEGVEFDLEARGDHFVRFYQRIESVGIWAFADGCLQVSCLAVLEIPDPLLTTMSASFPGPHETRALLHRHSRQRHLHLPRSRELPCRQYRFTTSSRQQSGGLHRLPLSVTQRRRTRAR